MTLYIHLREALDDDVEEIRHRFILADSIEIDDLGNVLFLDSHGEWQRIDRSGNKHDGYKFLYPVTDSNMKRTVEEYDFLFIRDRLMEGCRVGLQVFLAEAGI
tara:strand:+ start:6097 stop:6405 length:309 start_codon:yes stop_codon:yes gene_type:complete